MSICKQCGEELFWDEKVKSDSGRSIPLDKNGQKHNCPFSKFGQKTDKVLGGTPLEALIRHEKLIKELRDSVNRLEMEVRWSGAKSVKESLPPQVPKSDVDEWEQYKVG